MTQPTRRNTPPAVRLEILTDTLAAAYGRYRAAPSKHARHRVEWAAQRRLAAQLPAPMDPVELEVLAMFPETDRAAADAATVREVAAMPATQRAVAFRTALAAALLEDLATDPAAGWG